ncbi:hypothetical protein ACIQYS_03835 [Psychrobacillus sp. NPDC096426]|uniref:hypothetical protein n=1 Tax=Psychrobacillus sp. NPDC096426 TaxID=3364491 RepID=UPI0038031922
MIVVLKDNMLRQINEFQSGMNLDGRKIFLIPLLNETGKKTSVNQVLKNLFFK